MSDADNDVLARVCADSGELATRFCAVITERFSRAAASLLPHSSPLYAALRNHRRGKWVRLRSVDFANAPPETYGQEVDKTVLQMLNEK